MTILRASEIILALHYRLIETGLSPQCSLFVVNQLKYSGILAAALHERKSNIVDILVNDINESLKNLRARHKILSIDFGIEKEMNEQQKEAWNHQQEEECLTLLEIAIGVHYQPDQIIGY